MEGTWGRRVFGNIIDMDGFTEFRIDVELADTVVGHRVYVPSVDIADTPELYKYTLNKMVDQLDVEIERYHSEWYAQQQKHSLE